jgi:signal transduction histidine kinase
MFAALFGLKPLGATLSFLVVGAWMNVAMARQANSYFGVINQNLNFITVSLVSVAYSHLNEVWSCRGFVLQRRIAWERDRSASLLEEIRTEREQRVSWLENMAEFLRHELRNQLIGIQTSLRMLRGKYTSNGARFVERAERSASVMSRILEAATEATSLEGALKETERTEIDLAALAERHAREVSLAWPGIAIHFSAAGVARVRGDEARLVQLLDKISQNACDHVSAGGRVIVRAGAREDVAWIRIENDGAPVKGDIESLFQPFVSFRGASVKSSRNLGLGLYVARQVARFHGGDVLLVEAQEASGAAFEVVIPLLPVRRCPVPTASEE